MPRAVPANKGKCCLSYYLITVCSLSCSVSLHSGTILTTDVIVAAINHGMRTHPGLTEFKLGFWCNMNIADLILHQLSYSIRHTVYMAAKYTF